MIISFFSAAIVFQFIWLSAIWFTLKCRPVINTISILVYTLEMLTKRFLCFSRTFSWGKYPFSCSYRYPVWLPFFQYLQIFSTKQRIFDLEYPASAGLRKIQKYIFLQSQSGSIRVFPPICSFSIINVWAFTQKIIVIMIFQLSRRFYLFL